MKRTTIFWLLSCALVCVAQDGKSRPDFSGTWKLDRSKSELGRMGQAIPAHIEITLKISYADPKLTISRAMVLDEEQRSEDLVYFTDGRGETNKTTIGGEMKTKTKWEGKRIVSRASRSVTVRGEPIYIDTTEKRELSADGKTLVVSVTISGTRAPQTIKQVYTRSG